MNNENDNEYVNAGRFKVYTAKRVNDELLYEQQCGLATRFDHPSKPYFEARLWMLEKTLYICRNRDSKDKYTVFARYSEGLSGPIFQEPVGRGQMSNSLKTHMEIQLSFPRQRVFLSLFPEN